jgi:hypothetical protein
MIPFNSELRVYTRCHNKAVGTLTAPDGRVPNNASRPANALTPRAPQAIIVETAALEVDHVQPRRGSRRGMARKRVYMTADSEGLTTNWTRRRFLQGVAGGVAGLPGWLQDVPRVQAAPTPKNQASGQMTWAVHVALAPTWFDPAETSAMIPYMFLYAIHDALIKPMPGDPQCPCLATHWTESEDWLAYTFDLRQGLTFHNGDPFTAEDVRYSFERYHGTGAALLRAKVKQVVVSHPYQVRFQLHDPWPDFLTFYGGIASGAGWIVPQRYTEAVGSEKFTERPIGLGPYCVAQHTPGVELVLAEDAVGQTLGVQEYP